MSAAWPVMGGRLLMPSWVSGPGVFLGRLILGTNARKSVEPSCRFSEHGHSLRGSVPVTALRTPMPSTFSSALANQRWNRSSSWRSRSRFTCSPRTRKKPLRSPP